MILTNCAACAAPLAHNAPRCVRCHTRYCNATCQHTLGDLREALNTLEEIEPTARRVFGGAHPTTMQMVQDLQKVRAILRARETQPPRTFAPGWLDGPS